METKQKSNRNSMIDFIKGIACIFVVFIHVPFPGETGRLVISIARFAVPFFLFVSGYYSYNSDYNAEQVKFRKQLIHIIKLTTISVIFFVIVKLIVLQETGLIKEWISTALQTESESMSL